MLTAVANVGIRSEANANRRMARQKPCLTIRHVALGMAEAQVMRLLGKPLTREVTGTLGILLSYGDPEFPSLPRMTVGLKNGRVDGIRGYVLEAGGKEILRHGDRPAGHVFDILGPIDGYYTGWHLPGTPMPLRWPQLGLIAFAEEPTNSTGEIRPVPFKVDFILLYGER